MLNSEDKLEFFLACDRVTGKERVLKGIGTLSEKTLHAILKNFYEPDCQCQEIPVGNHVADIMKDGYITEIQTRGFDRLREKLRAFLPEHRVRVVYPVPKVKWLSWIDKDSGELSAKRKSPKKGSIYDIIPELYKIKPFLGDPSLHISICLLEIMEYRYLDGWSKDKKKGSSRCERIPLDIFDIVEINDVSDYKIFIPEGVGEYFTCKDISLKAGINISMARTVANILRSLDIITLTGKKGREYVYKLC